MSLLNSNSKRSSKPVFPYAVLPEKQPAGKKRVLVMVLVLVVAAAAVAGLLLLG